jgi:folate-binding protein YgfZ
MADSSILRSADGAEYWIVSVSSPSPAVARRLEGHIIADDVAIEDSTGSWRGLSLIGPGTGAWLHAEPRPGLLFPGRRSPGENWEWVFREGDAGLAGAAIHGARVISPDEAERLRIHSGIPSVPLDIGPADLPNEGGLETLAISYSKGCYLGQEVMARLRSRGRVRRTLVRVAGPGRPPGVPAALWRGDRREGELRSVAAAAGGEGYEGLALISAAAAAAGGPLALAAGGPPSLELVRGA